MKLVTLQNETPGLRLLLCRADKEGASWRYTGVRADGEPPIPMSGFSQDSNALIELDVRYDVAWRWMTASPLGYVTAEQRLRLLLGEPIEVDGWTVTPEA